MEGYKDFSRAVETLLEVYPRTDVLNQKRLNDKKVNFLLLGSLKSYFKLLFSEPNNKK